MAGFNLTDALEQLVPQIEHWVQGHIKRNPALQKHYEDLVAEAHLKMVEVVEKFGPDLAKKFDGKFDKFSAYIRLSTQTAIAEFFRHEHIVTHPHTQEPPQWEYIRKEPAAEELTPIEEILGTLRRCARDDCDREILEARMGGGTFTDTANRTGHSRNTIRKRLSLMRARYEKLTS